MTIYKGSQILAGGALPSQSGKAGKYLKTDGSNVSWADVQAGGNVDDVKVNGTSVVTNKVANITLSTVATTGSYNDLSNKPTIPTVPTNVSEFTNDAGYQTSAQVDSAISTHNSSASAHSDIRSEVAGKSTVSVSATGTATDEVGYITIDGVEKKLAGGSGGNSAHNVGDIFYTSRTDTTLAGAVECNGATYSTTDFSGAGAIGALLTAGKVPYISLSQYATDLAAHGSVRAFGWDGAGTTEFRVPTLSNVFIEAGQAASDGEYINAGLPNITGECGAGNRGLITEASGAFYVGTKQGTTSTNTSNERSNIFFDASLSNSIYGNSNTVQPNSVKYRAMVQLANGATDEALETCTGVLATVGTHTTQINVLNAHRVIDFQEPTADNGYTWYRKYEDGWVEQGGFLPNLTTHPTTTNTTVTLPIEMSDANYTLILKSNNRLSTSSNTLGEQYANSDYGGIGTKTSTTFICRGYQPSWLVSGIAK